MSNMDKEGYKIYNKQQEKQREVDAFDKQKNDMDKKIKEEFARDRFRKFQNIKKIDRVEQHEFQWT